MISGQCGVRRESRWVRSWQAGGWFCLVTTGLLSPCCAQVFLNEVLYDPAGADGGGEFVELYNAGAAGVVLAGYRLEFANGAVGPEWQTRWEGTAADSLAAGDFFLIVDRGWSQIPAGQAEVALSLQNGPDAVRLVRLDASVDLLGYGEPLEPLLSEGTPHPDVASGQSLGRRPDGADSDDNAADWYALEAPTPAAPNFPHWSARVDFLQFEPPSLARAGTFVEITLHLVNTGLAGWQGGTLVLRAGEGDLPGWLDPLDSGQSCVLRFHWQPESAGRHELDLVIPTGGGDLVLTLSEYQVGQDDIFLSEVMAVPPAGGCEWVEVGNAGTQPRELSSLRLRDEDGDWHVLPPIVLPGGDLVVLVQDRTRFFAWWEEILSTGALTACPSAQVTAAVHELPGSWPSLNNTPPRDRTYADRVYLSEGDGVVLDHVTLGGQGTELTAGRSFERISPIPRGDPLRNWVVATTPLGATPACQNSVSWSEQTAEQFSLRPNPFYPTGLGRNTVLHLFFVLGAGEEGWDAQIFDLWGHRVRDLGGDRLGPGSREVLWDGRGDDQEPLPPGAYIVLLRTYDAQAQLRLARKQLAVLGSGEEQ